VSPALRSLNLDFVFVDTEHVPIDRVTLAWMCQAYRGIGLPPIVRIPSPDPYAACMALDGGAAGIVAPYIETREQAEALRGAVKLRPLKGQRLNETLSGTALEDGLHSYITQRCATNTLILNIESVPALEALDDILQVPDIDAVLIGPHDLSCSLGIPEEYSHPRFLEAVAHIITTSRKNHVGVGIHTFYRNSQAQEIEWAKAGANLIVHGSDVLLFAETLRHDLAQLKMAVGDAREEDTAVDSLVI
jgi:4-hydroxy-2-oxoheptanedioate aldolase